MGHTHVTQNQTILKVFIASPSDVTAERDRAINALDEINRTTGNHFNVRLVAVRWELDTYPAIGDDAQSIINSQIQDDYDIFIGIMWVRVGTPTGRALSGTVEEFERAYRRYHNNGCRAPQIMFYFKNAPIKPSHIDSEQINSVLTFKGDISSRGILYKEFDTGDDFETFLRLHL